MGKRGGNSTGSREAIQELGKRGHARRIRVGALDGGGVSGVPVVLSNGVGFVWKEGV